MKNPKPVSLSQQIDEIERKLKERRKVYPRLVDKGSLRQSVADFQVRRMEAVLATLRWLEERERLIKQRLAY